MSVADQFNQPKTYRILDPTRLRVPASKNGAPLENPLIDLLCYAIKPAKNQPRHVPVVGVDARDEFATERLRTVKEAELCVPSEMVPGS